MKRRTFLEIAGMTSASALAVGLAGCGTEQSARSGAGTSEAAQEALNQIGVQLYTLRSLLKDDLDGPLEAVAQTGYETVETAGLYGLSPQDFRQALDRHGLRSPAGHYDLGDIRDDLSGIAETAQALGQQYVVAPYLAEEERQSLDDYRALADEFNEIGERFQEAGLQFGYHNHDFEFDTFGGDTPAFDVLARRTDPDLVTLELDVYWAYVAGHDPAAYFERYPGRFELAHLKDGTAPPEREMVDVGAGAINFEELLAKTEEAGLEYAFVEHDEPDDPLASIRASYEHLHAL